MDQWKIVFLIAGVTLIITGSLYMLFTSSTLKSWNSPVTGKIKKEKDPEVPEDTEAPLLSVEKNLIGRDVNDVKIVEGKEG